ncbi:MAG: DUF4388 domain-containing protein [Armatimonadetes bacterium]|nr:DUF4388 domain-containing protein [Armatimonadota bacterium]NIO74867.1 DUF4388 domain-containing protein [Armatimonadota bacterium]NIO95629.1 DUF4388 domain-containing protein [Armatimonadota bacterium]
MALTGTLDDLSFAEIVQVIKDGHKTGELTVQRGREEAKVKFSQGEIAQASLKVPLPAKPITGAEAIYRLLGWGEGEFQFTRSHGVVKRLLQETTDELILEGMKRLDEWEKVQKEITDRNVVLRLCASKVGEEYDKLSQEERAILQLVDARRDVAAVIRESGLDPTQALLIITELMGRELVEKWEVSPSAPPFPSELPSKAGEKAELVFSGQKGYYSRKEQKSGGR